MNHLPHLNTRLWQMTACFASSLDGVIHPISQIARTPDDNNVKKNWVKLGSDYDIHHLKSQRDEHDIILMGASTFRFYPKAHHGHSSNPPLVIFTRGKSPLKDIPPDAPAFSSNIKTGAPSTTIFSQALPSKKLQSLYPQTVQWIQLPQTQNQSNTGDIDSVDSIDWQTLLTLPPFNTKQRILFEGGGELFEQLLKAQWIDALTLTVTPQLLGGVSARPEIKSIHLLGNGDGFLHQKAPKLKLDSKKTRLLPDTSEIITFYHVTYP